MRAIVVHDQSRPRAPHIVDTQLGPFAQIRHAGRC